VSLELLMEVGSNAHNGFRTRHGSRAVEQQDAADERRACGASMSRRLRLILVLGRHQRHGEGAQ
jgi:hypothetical protein